MQNHNKIAVIGISGMFPDAEDLETFYHNLCEGKDSIMPVSPHRLADTKADLHASYKEIGLLDRVDLFDHAFFNISRKEAALIEPGQRILIELSCKAIENAGLSLDVLNGSNTAVYIGGNPYTTYRHLLEQESEQDLMFITGNLHSMTAGRIAYLLNLRGPAMMIDTACSSSLLAVHEACQKLLTGEVDYALAGGADIRSQFGRSADDPMGIESAHGRSRAFDAKADGIGEGEGGGMVLLKRLDHAIRDKDNIQGVILGSAVNHDGSRSNGLTAPSPDAQAEVITRAWQRAGITPESISYIEAHGAGTPLGDPIEFHGITKAFKAFTGKRHFCALSSVKTNLGHLNNAAGIAGMIKALLSLQYRKLFPSLHFKDPNPYIDFADTAAYVNTTLRSWPESDHPRRCGINSFGLTGTNVHLVLEEAAARAEKQEHTDGLLLKLSGRTPGTLAVYLRNVEAFIRQSGSNIADVVYTLGTGRKDHEYRLCLAAGTRDELLHQLEALNTGRQERDFSPVKGSGAVILLFSGDDIPGDQKDRLLRQFPAAARQWEQIAVSYGRQMNGAQEKFALQYALYHQITAYGIPVGGIIATGAGKICRQVINGLLSVEDALHTLAVSEDNDSAAPDEGKLKAAVEDLMKGGHTAFLEVAPKGALSEKLRAWQEARENIYVGTFGDPAVSASHILCTLYNRGINISWERYYAGADHHRITVPTYPFERTRCWITADDPQQETGVHDWFYRLDWVPEPLADVDAYVKGRTYLVVMDRLGLGERLIRRLERIGNRCVRVSLEKDFKAISPEEYEINFEREEDYYKLYDHISAGSIVPDGIIFLHDYSGWGPVGSHNIEERLAKGIYAQFLLLKAFHDLLERKGAHLVHVSSYGQHTDKEQLAPEKHAAIGLCKAVLSSNIMLKVNCLDLEFKADDNSELVEHVLEEMSGDGMHAFVCYRNEVRYVQEIRKVFDKRPALTPITYKEDGVYLITGGGSGIGLEIAKSIASGKGGRLVITGRSYLPDGRDWDKLLTDASTDPAVKERISALAEIRSYGAEVIYHQADAGDAAAMAAVFMDTRARFERIDGIIHSAGIAGDWAPLHTLSLDGLKDTLRAKVLGSIVLGELSAGMPPGYTVLFSSLNAIVPQHNSTGYTIANAFEDAYAAGMRMQELPFMAISWGAWSDTGMGARMNGNSREPITTAVKGWKTADGLRAFGLALALNRPNVLIGDFDLGAFRSNPFFKINDEMGIPGAAIVPEVQGEMTETERQLLEIWYEVLGAGQINLTDNFFNLGGHSLLGTRLIYRIEKIFDIELKYRDLLAYPTVSVLAAYIAAQKSSGIAAGHLAIPVAAVQEHYALSHAQKRLWLLSQIDPDTVAYNIPAGYTLYGELDVAAFSRALSALIERHESLRTIIIPVAGEPRQKILPVGQTGFSMQYHDLSGEAAADDLVKELVAAEYRKPFGLDSGPLTRANLVKTGHRKYVFLMTMHHIISDGWSAAVLMNELWALYDAFKQGGAHELPPLPIQYKDYAEWQNSRLSGAAMDAHRAYWSDRFADLPLPLGLDVDYSRASYKAYSGSHILTTLDTGISAKWKAFCSQRQVSLFTGLLAVVKAILYKYTGKTDIVVGSPVAGREHIDLEGQVGFYVNMLPLRTRFSPQANFLSLLEEISHTIEGAYEHQAYPFDRLLEDLQLIRDGRRFPLFDVVVVMQNTQYSSLQAEAAAAITVEEYRTDVHTSKFDLTFAFIETADGIIMNIEYNDTLFRRERIGQITRQFRNMLQAVLDRNDVPLSGPDHIDAGERNALLQYERIGYPRDKTIIDIFEAQVKLTPQNIALSFEGNHMTYDELNNRANQLGHYLGSKGVGRNALVPVCVERSMEMVIALLGVLKAGAAYVPVDPAYPLERIRYIVGDTGADLMIAGPGGGHISKDIIGIEVISLSGEGPVIDSFTTAQATAGRDVHDLAYVIYTSGSTGGPKGVMIEDEQVVRLLKTDRPLYDFGQQDVWTMFHSFCFDFSVWEMYGALFFGGRLVIVPGSINKDMEAFTGLLEEEAVTVLNQTPSAFYVFQEHALKNNPELNLRYVIFGGEALNPARLKGWKEKYPACTLVNMYGITETTVHVTYKEITAEEIHAGISNIGKPIPTLTCYVLDGEQQLLPAGVTGEMYVGGSGVARGYLNRPELDRKRFISDPFSQHPGARLYRTGDLARYLFNGELEYLGRIDEQVKIRGYRIEPGEIEKVLGECAMVRQAAVLAADDAGGQKRLVGYVVPAEIFDPGAIRSYMASRLPEYMIPALFVRLNELPLTANGKTDRSALLKMDVSVDGKDSGTAPQTAAERQLASLWSEVLHVTAPGVTDDFFSLGGDSLKVIRLVNKINESFGSAIKVGDLYAHPTIRQLTDKLLPSAQTENLDLQRGEAEIRRIIAPVVSAVEERPALLPGYEDIYPLTPIETGMIYSSLLQPEVPVYYDQFSFDLEINSFDRFIHALKLLVDRHSILRTRYYLSRFSESVKVVFKEIGTPLLVEDVSHLSREEQRLALRRYSEEDLSVRLSFDGDILWRMKIFRLSANKYVLIWNFHHAILDGWSVSIFTQELSVLLGQEQALPPLRHSYKDYCALLLGRSSDPHTHAFWRDYLDGYSRNKLPFNYTGKKNAVGKEGTGMHFVRRTIGQDTFNSLKTIASTHNIAFKAICLSAHIYLMHIICAEADVVTGVVTHDRPAIADADRILGCFLNTIPIRIRMDESRDCLSLIREVNRQLIILKQHEIHLSEVASAIGEKSSLSNPVFDCILNYTDFHILDEVVENNTVMADTEGIAWEEEERATEMTNTLFDLEVDKTYGGLTCRIKYLPAYFNRRSITYALELYERILQRFACDIHAHTSTSLLNEDEHRHLTVDFNNTATPYPDKTTLHALFELQAKERAGHTALRYQGEGLCYGDLNRWANRIAHMLMNNEVGKGDNVCLLTGRGFAMIAGMLGILKAGAAYVPVDPAYPAERQLYIIQHSSARAILADGEYSVKDGAGDGLRFLLVPDAPDSDCPDQNPDLQQSSNDLAYTIYTSGSTGHPKGVMIAHHSAVNLLEWVNRTYAINEHDRLLFITSMCFDLSVYDIFGMLSAGGTIVIAAQEDVQDVNRLQYLLREEGVTFWDSVPTTMNYLIDGLETVGSENELPALRLVFLSGDWIPVNLPLRLKRYFPNARTISLGGATEAAVWSNYYEVDQVDPEWTSIPYGKPLANNCFYILDGYGNPVPNGVAGELYIGGVGVAMGYANDPGKTGYSFVKDPFNDQLGGRMYRTGDMGRMMADGNMEFLGRRDHQVKVRGYRVELGEIEHWLKKYPGVKEAVVLYGKSKINPADSELTAYMVAGREVGVQDIRSFLGNALPYYMVPANLMILEAFPYNLNGKLDINALRNIEPAGITVKPEYTPPRTETERKLASIWAALLKTEEISITDNFFDLGADSLRMVRALAEVRRLCSERVGITDLFTHYTIEKLAAYIDAEPGRPRRPKKIISTKF